ncbi:MAG: sugar transferase [Dehalococcoidia bacterium]|nr:sugar transferase [Dehalococcoidia bacterium]
MSPDPAASTSTEAVQAPQASSAVRPAPEEEGGRAVLDDKASTTGSQVPEPSQPRGPHLRERRLLLLIGDLAASNLALLAAVLWRGWWDLPGNVAPAWWFVTLTVLAVIITRVSDSDDVALAANPYASSYASGRAGLITTMLYLFAPYVSAPLPQSRAAMVLFLLVSLILRVGWRAGYALLIRQPRFATRLAVVGHGPSAQSFVAAVQAYTGPEHQIVGCVVDRSEDTHSVIEGAPLLGGPEALGELVERRAVSLIVLALQGPMSSAISAQVIRAYEAGVQIVPMAAYYESLTGRVPIDQVGDYWIFAVPAAQLDWPSALAKRVTDVVGALVGLAIILLAIVPIATAVRLSGPGPIVFTQTRAGLRGRQFRVRKFRTMAADAELAGEAQWAVPDDPRVTWAGRWLRASRLDELPQFWNVLRGEMSLVGPRPERPEFIAQLQETIPFYRARLLVKPGITGWAQVKQEYAGSLEDTVVKLQYDLYYINHQSLYLDLLILLKTVSVILRLQGR